MKSELEKERIALELEEEKKAKAQRERRLQEQEIKIANLSSMVLDTKRDDNSSATKKVQHKLDIDFICRSNSFFGKRSVEFLPLIFLMTNRNLQSQLYVEDLFSSFPLLLIYSIQFSFDSE